MYLSCPRDAQRQSVSNPGVVYLIPNVDAKVYEKLEKLSMDNAYDQFR